MYISKTIFVAVVMLAVLSVNNLFAQSNVKTDTVVTRKQSFVLYVGGGLAGYTTTINPTAGILQGDVSKIKRVSIFAGIGSYWLTTRLNYDGQVKSKTFSLGSNIALSYIQPLSKTLGLAAEAKWMNAFETKDNLLSLQVLLVWQIFR